MKNGQKSTASRKTAQRATGDIKDDRRGMSRVVTRATPKNTSSTPTPIHSRTLVVPRPGTKSPYRSAANPSAPDTSAPIVLDGKSAQPKRIEEQAEDRQEDASRAC